MRLSLPLFVPNGQTDATYWVQGVEGATGTITETATATGFTSSSGTVTVVQAAYRLDGLPASPNSFSPNQPIYATVGVPNTNNTALSILQTVRPGQGFGARFT